MRRSCSSWLCVIAALGSLGSACSDDTDSGAPSGKDAGAEGTAQQYMLGSNVSGAESEMSYFTLLDSLTRKDPVRYDSSVEQLGVVRLYGGEGHGYFVLGIEESLELVRYEVGEDGELTKGKSFSVQQEGVSAMVDPSQVQFVSETEAYFIDSSQLQVIVWNPQEMSITKVLDLGALLKDGAVTTTSVRSVVRGDDLILAAGWQDEDAAGVHDGISLVTIDLETKEVEIEPQDDRCRDPGAIELTADGSVYIFSNYSNVYGKLVSGRGGADCVLRVKPNESKFDPDYLGSIADAVDGAPSVGIVLRDKDTLWALVLDQEEARFGKDTTFGDFFGEVVWRWVSLDFPELKTATSDPDRALTGYNSNYFRVDGHLYVSESNDDFTQTTLLDISKEKPVKGLSFPGAAGNLIRVR